MGIIADKINTAMRDFVRFTGDGKPGAPVDAALPVGDPASGEWNPPKKQVREAFVAMAGSADDLDASALIATNAAQTATTKAGEAVDSANDADTSATQAQLAALAAGAPLFLTEGEGIAGVADGEMFLVYSDHGVDVYTRNGAAADYEGSLIARPYKTVPDLIASNEASRGVGAIWQAGGERFSEADPVATDHNITNAAGVKLYRVRQQVIQVTVGAAGEYPTINMALEFLSGQKRSYKKGGVAATVHLLTGFELNEQVVVTNGVDLSWVKITAADAVVTAKRSALVDTTSFFDGMGVLQAWSAFFMAGGNAALPRIGCVFSMDTSGTASYTNCGLFITRGSKAIIEPGCGFWDTDGNGAVCVYSSILIANDTLWKRNGREKPSTSRDLSAILAAWQGIVTAIAATVEDSNDCGMLIIGGSVASVRDATITRSARHGLYTGSVSIVHARGISLTDNGAKGLNATEGSMVRLILSTVTGNGGNGVFISEGSVVNGALGVVISNNGENGVKVIGNGRFSATSPAINNNAGRGIDVSGGEVNISGGEVMGNLSDFFLGGQMGIIRLSGSVTSTSGSSPENNVTDSNTGAFNVLKSSGDGGMFGRGGPSAERGTATITSGSTSVTVTHGVEFSPIISEVSVTPTNSMNSATNFWVSGLTDTQFVINVDVDPSAGGADFAWSVRRIV